MIDSHAHLHMEPLNSDIDGVIKRFVDNGGKYILSCAIDEESANREIEVSLEHDEVYTAVGYHPEIVIPGCDDYKSCICEDWIDRNITKLSKLVNKYKKIIAIGEVGLDYYWVKNSHCEKPKNIYRLQHLLLKKQLNLASKTNLPVILHCRDVNGDKQCESDILKIITGECKSCVRGVFHSYTGSVSYLEQILNLGFYISFNSIVTFRNAENVRNILDLVPNDRILLETDAPFLIPRTLKDVYQTTSEPYMVNEVAKYIAERKEMKVEQLWEIIEQNFIKLFNL